MAVIRHVALRCKDMERTRNFYETAFEWEFLGYRPSGAGLDLSDGMCNITLIQQPSDCDRPILEDGDESDWKYAGTNPGSLLQYHYDMAYLCPAHPYVPSLFLRNL